MSAGQLAEESLTTHSSLLRLTVAVQRSGVASKRPDVMPALATEAMRTCSSVAGMMRIDAELGRSKEERAEG